ALGDSSYPNFCNGGKQFDALLQEQSAQRVGEMLFIDASEHPDKNFIHFMIAGHHRAGRQNHAIVKAFADDRGQRFFHRRITLTL
ncbi:flavodoxin domain-containing protein, partial [Salmonella enterica subsp. enterica serovar Kentucky]|nr:flavodoxin domain-containing protein [Salmonella enterica subsp. enterica serovar Kentucky]